MLKMLLGTLTSKKPPPNRTPYTPNHIWANPKGSLEYFGRRRRIMLETPPGDFGNVTQTNTVNHIQEAESQLNHVQSQSQLTTQSCSIRGKKVGIRAQNKSWLRWQSSQNTTQPHQKNTSQPYSKTQTNRIQNTIQPYSKTHPTVFKTLATVSWETRPTVSFLLVKPLKLQPAWAPKTHRRTLSGNTVGSAVF